MEEKEGCNNCKEWRQKIISQAPAWYCRRLGKEPSCNIQWDTMMATPGKSVLG